MQTQQAKSRIGEFVAVQEAPTLVTGPSSMIFWCRRCTEQSLEYREQQLPCSSHSSWTSRWREAAASFMAKIGDPGTSPCTYKQTRDSVRNGLLCGKDWPRHHPAVAGMHMSARRGKLCQTIDCLQ